MRANDNQPVHGAANGYVDPVLRREKSLANGLATALSNAIGVMPD